MCAQHPGWGQGVQLRGGLLGVGGGNGIGGAHAGQAQCLIGGQQLPHLGALRVAQAGRATQTQRRVGAVQHHGVAQRLGCGGAVVQCAVCGTLHPRGPCTVGLAQGAGRLAGPDQIRCIRLSRWLQTPRLRGMGVVAIGMVGQAHGARCLLGALPFDPRRAAKNELAGAARQHHAPRWHAVKACQRRAQIGIGGVGVAGGIGGLHSGQDLRARATGVAVAGKVVQRRALCVRSAVDACQGVHGRAPIATNTIAACAMTTRARSVFDA